MQNHNNQMPYTADYGYSGYQSSSSSSVVKLATATAGGALAGTALGFGAAYMLASTTDSGSSYGEHRRRRANAQVQWCIVQKADEPTNGNFQECSECYQLYGAAYCQSADCDSASGCSYTTASNFNRDDLQATGFVPAHFTWPLTVTFTEISGEDIVTDPLSGGLCPPTTSAEVTYAENFNRLMTITPDLFLVLTLQDELANDAGITDNGASTVYAPIFALLISTLAWAS